MFKVECRKIEPTTVGKWFPVWETKDGTEAAKELASCVVCEALVRVEHSVMAREYKITYNPKPVSPSVA